MFTVYHQIISDGETYDEYIEGLYSQHKDAYEAMKQMAIGGEEDVKDQGSEVYSSSMSSTRFTISYRDPYDGSRCTEVWKIFSIGKGPNIAPFKKGPQGPFQEPPSKLK